jgi:tetratricopeptide (TPR) repeat protein
MVSNNRIEMADQRSTARLSINELIKQAKLLESEGKLEDAVKNYHTVIAKDKLHTAAYNRLMIVYHRQKMYKKELSTIKKALAVYENDLLKDQRKWKKLNGGSADLSQRLAKVLGLMQEDGLPRYEEPQVMAWRKRLGRIEQSIKKAKGVKT